MFFSSMLTFATSHHRIYSSHGLLHLPHHSLPSPPRRLLHYLQAPPCQYAQEVPLNTSIYPAMCACRVFWSVCEILFLHVVY